MSDHQAEQHDAFAEHRKNSLYWLRNYQEELATLALLEGILPSFVRRRYRIASLHRIADVGRGYLSLEPAGPITDDLATANALHADVDKLFGFLLGKCQGADGAPERPTREVTASTGHVRYEFTLSGLPGFEDALDVTIGRLPAGSACHITKKVKGTRVVEDVEYEMVCDDDAPGISPEERAEEAEREAVQ
ncbi:hypothetical protein LCGC14_1049180 [marine sediment metagenome]|uniref:Uncharacterized protein n=1 Tax=marine sediment metagenome TaxID=412755 RepID=A0A0F9MPD4_9ZZZZ